MLELILLALITYFIIRKLKSVLGEESDEMYFGYDAINKKCNVKEAEKVNEEDEEAETKQYCSLSDDAKKNLDILRGKIENFSLSKFTKIASKVVEYVFNANNERNSSEIKKFLSSKLADVVCETFKNNDKNYIFLVSFKGINVCDIVKNSNVFEIKIIFNMEQINYTTNENDDVIDGDKHNIVNVSETWTFVHDFSKKDNIWLVNDIEEE
jgi:predicted lipid-binding transport protein (Tim44 family)